MDMPLPSSAERPLRRLLAVTVMYGGLILPVLALLPHANAAAAGLLVPVVAWLTLNLVGLWKGADWAWIAGLIQFGGLTFVGLAAGLAAYDERSFAVVAAATVHMGLTFALVVSLKEWIRA